MQFVPRFDYGRSYLFLMMQSARVQAEIVRRVSGSTGSRQRARPPHIANLRILLPTAAVVRAFEALLAPVLACSSNNLDQLRQLGSLRDTLLPKLVFGELAVNALS
jgi:type I restriction enzyme S subunit